MRYGLLVGYYFATNINCAIIYCSIELIIL